jgi:hypothetical protein
MHTLSETFIVRRFRAQVECSWILGKKKSHFIVQNETEEK